MTEPRMIPLTAEMRPRDEKQDGSTLTFTTREHDEMTMPQAIIVTDREGRYAYYVPLERHGAIVVPELSE